MLPPPTTTTTTTPSSCTGAAAATPAADPSLPLVDADHTSSTIGTGESAALTPTPAVTTSTTINNPATPATTSKSLRASSFGQPIKFLRSSTMTTTTAITPNNGNNNNNNRVQQLVFHQCLLYVVAFWSCLTPLIVVRVLEGPFNWPRSQESQIYWLLIWQAICGPLQGCCNLLIYALPRYKQLRLLSKRNGGGRSRIWCLRGALWGTDADDHVAAVALVGPQEQEIPTQRIRKQKQKPENLTAVEEGNNNGNLDFAT